MKDKRPKNMDMTTMKLPIMGVASILHRVSAVIIWISLVYFLPILYISLESAQGFAKIETMLIESFTAKFFTWGFMTAAGYYIFGGLKHMIQELGYFESLQDGKLISQIAIGLGVVLSVVFGIWIWG
jgi:succinate dehydrogenase / fumarate reductase cytochrome b subunit